MKNPTEVAELCENGYNYVKLGKNKLINVVISASKNG
jgi:hypothetical protein